MTADEALYIARYFLGRRARRAWESVRAVDLDEELVRLEHRTGEQCPEAFRHMVAGKFAVHFERGTNAGVGITVHVTKANGAAQEIWPR